MADAILALTAAQTGIWYGQQIHPDSPMYNAGEYVELHGNLDVPQLAEALRLLVSEADTLRAHILDDGDTPVLGIHREVPVDLTTYDMTDSPSPLRDAVEHMRGRLRHPVNLRTEPPFEYAVYRLGERYWAFFYRYHHIGVDGYSVALLTQRIAEIYSQLCNDGRVSPSPFERLAALVDADAAYRRSEQCQQDADYWRAEIAAAGTPATLGRIPNGLPGALLRVSDVVEAETVTLLKERARKAEVIWPSLVFSSVALYLHEMTGSAQPVLGLPVTGRIGRVGRLTPGMTSNVLPMRIPIKGGLTVSGLFKSSQTILRRSMRHNLYRYEDIVRKHRNSGGTGPVVGPEVNIMLFNAPLRFGDMEGKITNLSIGPCGDLSVNLYDRGTAGVTLELDASPACYDLDSLVRHRDRLLHLLTWLSQADPTSFVSAAPSLTAEETAQIDAISYGPVVTSVPEETLLDAFDAAVTATPDAPAVEFRGRTLTYAQLDHCATKLAAILRTYGVGPETLVGIQIPRGMDLVVAIYGVVKAGGAYVPIDPSYPQDRIRVLVEDSGAALVVSTSDLALPAGVSRIDVDALPESVESALDAARPTLDHPAYVIFTSGSTGHPKGVVISHRSIRNRLAWMQDHYGLKAGERVLQKTTASFDVSVWEFFWPIIVGATLVVAEPDGHRDPAYLAEVIREREVTTIHFVPSMLAAFLDEPTTATCTKLRHIICSGEALPIEVAHKVSEVLPAARLHNLYGPTEAAVDVTAWTWDAEANRVPIGVPVWNTGTHVLGPTLKNKPIGMIGELYLSGMQLARGYHGRPVLTADRFVANPFGPAGSRMYRTGDLTSWSEEGTLLYHGRTDDQVKIRGQRVELGEIEDAMGRQPGVKAAAATIRGHDSTAVLVGYVVPDGTIDLDALRAALREVLPSYMVPVVIVDIESLPLSHNGKLDRKALPEPAIAEKDGRSQRTPREEILLDLFKDVLRRRSLGIDDNFFECGGHSLLAARLIQRIRTAFGVTLSMRTIFENPTVALLVGELGKDASLEESLEALLPLRRSGDGEPVFCIHPAGGLSWCYSGLIRHLAPEHPLYGIQSAGLDGTSDIPQRSLSEVATDYVSLMRSVRPQGPYHLVGYSSGGIIAHEVASQLAQTGDPTGHVIILDTYPGQRLAPIGKEEILADMLKWVGFDRRHLRLKTLTLPIVQETLARLGSSMASLEDRHVQAITRIYESNRQLVDGADPSIYPGDIAVVVATLDKIDISPTPATWQPFTTGRIDTYSLDRRHEDLMKPGPLAEVGQIISGILSRPARQIGGEAAGTGNLVASPNSHLPK